MLDDLGGQNEFCLGDDFERGEVFQSVVPAECWFGAALKDKDSFALVGCTVAPGFDFDDFELAEQASLLEAYPEHAELIRKLS